MGVFRLPQSLYQHIRGKDERLWDTLNRIRLWLEAIGEEQPPPTTAIAVPGLVSFTPKVVNYGHLSIDNISVEDNTGLSTVDDIYAIIAYVDETITSWFNAELKSPIDYNPSDPDEFDVIDVDIEITDEMHDRGVAEFGIPYMFLPGDFILVNDPDKDTQNPPIAGEIVALIEDMPTRITDAAITGSELPAKAPFTICIDDYERMDVWKLTSEGWWVNRAVENTSPIPHLIGEVVEVITKESFDRRRYEIAKIIAVTPEPTNGVKDYTLTLKRHQDGCKPNRAWYESFMSSHSDGLKIYKVQEKRSNIGINEDSTKIIRLLGQRRISTRQDVCLPSACVCAVSTSLGNAGGYGKPRVVNCASLWDDDPEVVYTPGLRTSVGSFYMLELGDDSLVPIRSQYPSSIRCTYAEVNEAAAALIVISLLLDVGDGLGFQEIEQIEIPMGEFLSYDPDVETPLMRQMPFGMLWPVPSLEQDRARLSYSIISGDPGSSMKLYVQT